MPKNLTKYQRKWEEELDPNGMLYKSWCKRQDDKNAWCKLCERTVNVCAMGKSAIKQHASSKLHQKLLVPNSEESQEIELGTTQHEETDDDNIDEKIAKAEILWSLFCAEHDLSFLVNDHATNIFKKMFPDSAIAAGYKCGRTKMNYTITHGTSKTFTEELNEKLKENVFSLQIDESNKMYGKKFLIMLVKFYDDKLGKIVNRFWESKITNKADAESIIKAITTSFAEHDVPFTNLIQIMSDSPNVMRGVYQGVVTKITKQNAPHLIDLGGCSLHHVSNAVKNATHKLYKAEDVEELLQDASSFFSFHVEFAEEFSELQEELHIDQHRLIKYCSVRFLSIYSSVKRIIEQYQALKSLFLIRIPKYHSKVAKQQRVIRIAQKLNDKFTLPTLEFLSFALEPYHKYEQLFQRSEPTLHLLYNKQVELFRTTLLSFCKFDKIEKLKTDSELVKFDYNRSKNHLDKSKIELGVKATTLLKNMSQDDKNIFTFGVKEYLIKLADGLHKDLSLQNKVLADLRCLAPINRTVAFERAIVRLAKKIPPSSRLSTNEIDKLPLEWKYLVLEKISVENKVSLELYWGNIFQLKDEAGEIRFPIISKVVKCCLALAEANASVERSFSQIAHVIRKDRSQLLPETVNALMVTKSHMENTQSCYKQEIGVSLMTNVKTSSRLYFDRNKDTDVNNNELGPSQSQSVEDDVCTEIKYQEEKIKINNASAKRLMEEATELMTENQNLTKDLEKLKKRKQKCKTASKSKRSRN